MGSGVGRWWRTAESAASRMGLGRLRRVPGVERFVYGTVPRILHRFSRRDFAVVQGHRMRLDPGDHLRLSLAEVYEPFVTRLVVERMPTGGIAVDVGANIGYHTLLLARKAGPEGRVVAFEPHPHNVEILRENIRENGYSNVRLEAAAVADAPGELELSIHPTAGGHSLRSIGEERIRVPAVRLDDALAEVPSVDLIKIDVEGAEGLAFAGARAVLRRSPRLTILMEYNRSYLDEVSGGADAMLRLLEEEGFRFLVLEDRGERLVPATREELLRRASENVMCERAH